MIQRLVVSAKVTYAPHDLMLLLKLWDQALENMKPLIPQDALIVSVPRPMVRVFMEGPGLVPHLIRSPILKNFKRWNGVRAYHRWFHKKPRTSFKLSRRFQMPPSASTWIIIDDLLTQGTTISLIGGLLRQVDPSRAIYAITFAGART